LKSDLDNKKSEKKKVKKKLVKEFDELEEETLSLEDEQKLIDSQEKVLAEFVETELVPGNLSSDLSFDELFDNWKQEKVKKEVKRFAQDWGIDESLLSKSVDNFSVVREDDIPYIAELSES